VTIDTTSWVEFKIGDLFELRKGTRLTKANMIEGNIRFVSAANANNGVTAHIGNNDHVHSEGTISVCYNGNGGTGKAFYQDRPYWASDDVHVLYPRFRLQKEFGDVEWTGLNPTVGLFLATTIERVGRTKYGFTDKWKLEYMREDKIKLPVDIQGEPNWTWMQQYMGELMERADRGYSAVSHIDIELESLVNTASWASYQVGALFEPLESGYIGHEKRIGSATTIPDADHTIPLTCAKYGNNGIMYWGRPEDYATQTNVIAVIRDGAISTGKVYAQKGEVGVYSHSYLIRLKTPRATFEINMFLARVLENTIYAKYSRDNACIWEKVKNETILLPHDEDGVPNWNYMDAYMRKELERASVILNCLNSALDNNESSC